MLLGQQCPAQSVSFAKLAVKSLHSLALSYTGIGSKNRLNDDTSLKRKAKLKLVRHPSAGQSYSSPPSSVLQITSHQSQLESALAPHAPLLPDPPLRALRFPVRSVITSQSFSFGRPYKHDRSRPAVSFLRGGSSSWEMMEPMLEFRCQRAGGVDNETGSGRRKEEAT